MSPAKGRRDDTACVVSFNDGKTSIKQKPLALDKLSDTLQHIVRFREMCTTAVASIEVIPDEHLPLIATLAHESSMLIGGVSRNIRKLLIPDTGAEPNTSTPATERVPIAAFEKAVTTVAERVNYGIDDAPAPLCEWRWEAKDLSHFPEDLREKLEARRADRIKAKQTLISLFNDLPLDKRDEYMKGAKPRKERPVKEEREQRLHTQDTNQIPGPSTDKSQEKEAVPTSHQESRDDEETHHATPNRKKSKTENDPEKTPKVPVKKTLKGKETEDTKKSAAMFASFFKKAPAKDVTSKASSSTDGITVSPSKAAATSAAVVTDFASTFHPFTTKKDAILAPVNRFLTGEYNRAIEAGNKVIELSTNGRVVIELKDEEEDNAPAEPSALLTRFVTSIPPAYRLIPFNRISRATPVRRVLDKINDAEVEGDEQATARLLQVLKDRKRYPIKLLQFHKDVRPAYWGTWTKSSLNVKPRKPFGQDTSAFDYEYDSEEDWEEPEEGGGEDIDADAMSVDEDEDESDTDSWLAPDDEIEEAAGLPGSPPPLDEDIFTAQSKAPAPAPTPAISQPYVTKKRKAATGARDNDQKKRKVVPLVPWIKGPYWEDENTKPIAPAFKAHRIVLLNEAPYPIDPFTWISDGDVSQNTLAAPTVAPDAPSKSGSSLAVPPLVPKKSKPTTNRVFPEEHVQYLLKAVAAHDGPLNVLCENVYKELQPHKVYKNCIEQKIRAVSERKGRKWVVKPEAWISVGLVPPPPTT